jgi:hypothetical protein
MLATTFKINVTPPLGSALCGGYLPSADRLVQELWLRGLIVKEEGQTYIIAGIDFCYLIGKSQARLEEALALGAGIPAGHVTLNATHAHAAPLITQEGHAQLHALDASLDFHNEAYFQDVLERSRAGVASAIKAGLWTVSGVSFSSHAVEEFASTRRVFLKPGEAKIRWSISREPEVKAAPVGLVDPLLDQVNLYDDDGKPRVSMSYFACHPQVGYNPGAIHGDTPGLAMSLFEERYPGTMPIYFNGCGGDITGGKYTSTFPTRNLHLFSVRLFDAMEEAFLKARPAAPGKFTWQDNTFDCPLAPVQFTRQELLDTIANPATANSLKIISAFKLMRLETANTTYPFRITHAHFGDIGLLMLPAELSVVYQLYAKQIHRGPIATAAYADSYLNYVAYDKAFDEGGYEVDPWWTEVGPGIEAWIKDKLDKVINPKH